MFYPPAIGDRFAYLSIDDPIGTIERITKTSDCTIWLWCGGDRYPWYQCEPIGVWQALALEFVADLSNCNSHTQVTELMAGLSDADRKTIWSACPAVLQAHLYKLREQCLPSMSTVEFKPLPPIHKSNGKTEARKAAIA
jgi:hypothetical protein